jgi:hypothetical protein
MNGLISGLSTAIHPLRSTERIPRQRLPSISSMILISRRCVRTLNKFSPFSLRQSECRGTNELPLSINHIGGKFNMRVAQTFMTLQSQSLLSAASIHNSQIGTHHSIDRPLLRSFPVHLTAYRVRTRTLTPPSRRAIAHTHARGCSVRCSRILISRAWRPYGHHPDSDPIGIPSYLKFEPPIRRISRIPQM